MSQILTISLREITRLRARFSGRASPLTIVLLLAVLGLAVFALRDVASLGSGLYRVGLTGDAPQIHDDRFATVAVGAEQGQELLEEGAIDVIIDGARVISRQDDKSQFAVSALKRYLAKQELVRIEAGYDRDQAFPLRVGINYLDPNPSPTTINAPEPETSAEVLIPSLMSPPAPFTQVIVALVYVLPVTFISIFFTSSFMDEKVNRRLTVLLSTPVTPLMIIVGKMLPYAIFATTATMLIAWLTHANIALAVAIFTPTTMFIFAIYLMVPLLYRTFKDTTFISMLVTTLTTAYLVFPAMFTGLNDLSYMSPLTLAVKMYRDEPFGWREYLFPSLPMAAIFGLAIFAATRMLNEEYLMGYRPITRKVADAVYLMINRKQPYFSIALLSLLMIPIVYMMQLVILAIASNLPIGFMLGGTLVAAVLVEEIVKSMGIAVLIQHGIVKSAKKIVLLAFLSGLGFLIGEKLLLFFSVSMVAESSLAGALFSAGALLIVPLLAHCIFTSIVTLLYAKARFSYPVALLVVTVLHSIYNFLLTRGMV